MYFDQYQSYYQAHSDPALFASEVMQEQEWERMESFYTDTSRRLLDAVRDQCQRLDYEGSWIYDEYPDMQTIRRLVGEVREESQPELSMQAARSGDFLDDLIRVLFLQELARRRCRNQRCQIRDNNRPGSGRPGDYRPDHRPPVR